MNLKSVLIPILYVYIISSPAIPFARATTSHREKQWDWEKMPKEEIDFFNTHLLPIIELHETEGIEVALKKLDEVWDLAKEERGGTWYIGRAIWFEAQVHSGKQDPEWGLALYEYLFNKRIITNPLRNDSPSLYPSEYILCGNIMLYCRQLGKAALNRRYSLMVEESLKNDLHFDLTGASYEDIGPIFSFLDDARRRNFPIFHHEMKKSQENESSRDFFYYPTMYGVRYVARTAMHSGDWKKAAELSNWCIRYAHEYLVDQTLMKSEVNRSCSYEMYKILSDIAQLHGYPNEAAHFLEKYINLSEGYYETGEITLLRAKLELASIQIQTGELPDDILALAEEAVKKRESNLFSSRMGIMHGYLIKARLHHALSQTTDAWEIVDDLLKKMTKDQNPQYWLRILDTAIDLALDDGASRPEIEEWLQLALENARQTGNKFKELPLYEKYARFLWMRSRYAEAVRIQQEAVRLSRAMNLPKRLQDNLDVQVNYVEKLENQQNSRNAEPNETLLGPTVVVAESSTAPNSVVAMAPVHPQSGSETSKSSAIDIQPRLSRTASLKDQAAYGRFYVHNPSFATQTGKLCLTGPIDQVQWQSDQWLTVRASPVFETVELTKEIQLKSTESCIIDIIGLPLEDGNGAKVQCRWVPEDQRQNGIAGSWSYQTAETEKRTAVIDAHELQDNPFYLIPIHHMVQRTDTTQQQPVDFAVVASSPMRVESYDAATGRLLAIDANGDGDFLDTGDLIVGDQNRNNWPDLAFEKDQNLSSLVMYVQPTTTASCIIETELTINIKMDGEWQTDAVDVIKPYSAKQ